MAYNKTLVADAVIAALVEAQGIFSACNRSYDGLVQQGATSVDIPAMPTLVAKTTGTSSTHADRKGIKGDTTMVNVPLSIAAVPIKEELLGRFETNGRLLQDFIAGARDTLSEKFDSEVLTEAITTTQVLSFADANLSWKDIMKVSAVFNAAKVPQRGRLIVIPTGLEEEFYDIDVVKTAVAQNRELLEGSFVRIRGMNFYISANVPKKVAGKENIIGIYGPGLVFILSRFMEQERVYDETNLQVNIDFLAHFGKKLLRNQFAVVVRQPD
jgi:hypothetical protein